MVYAERNKARDVNANLEKEKTADKREIEFHYAEEPDELHTPMIKVNSQPDGAIEVAPPFQEVNN